MENILYVFMALAGFICLITIALILLEFFREVRSRKHEREVQRYEENAKKAKADAEVAKAEAEAEAAKADAEAAKARAERAKAGLSDITPETVKTAEAETEEADAEAVAKEADEVEDEAVTEEVAESEKAENEEAESTEETADKAFTEEEAADDEDAEENGIWIAARQRETLEEKYLALTNEQKAWYDEIERYAMTKENIKHYKNDRYEDYKVGKHRIVRLTIKRKIVQCEFVLINRDLQNYINDNKVAVKPAPIIIKVDSDESVETAKNTVDIALKAVEEERLYKKEKQKEKRRLARAAQNQ